MVRLKYTQDSEQCSMFSLRPISQALPPSSIPPSAPKCPVLLQDVDGLCTTNEGRVATGPHISPRLIPPRGSKWKRKKITAVYEPP